MSRFGVCRITVIVLLTFTWFPSIGSAVTTDSPADILRLYFAALINENWTEAESYWLPNAVALSRRLGIRYTDVKAKYDCASPVFRSLPGLQDGTVRVKIHQAEPSGNHVVVPFDLLTGATNIPLRYHLVESGDTWKIASPLDLFTRSWSTHTTRFAVVHAVDSALVNPYALGALDRFVDSLGRLLRVSEDRMRELEREKFDYYLCDVRQVERLTGFAVPGMTDLQFDAIVTGHLPHYHELTHAMLNFALGELPLYTLPVIQEGAAVCLGGRWGKSAEVILSLGDFVIGQDIASVEDVLSHDGFHSADRPSDLSYAVGGVLSRCLWDHLGPDRFQSLYLRLSGSDEQVREWTTDSVRAIISGACGMEWSGFEGTCLGARERSGDTGLMPVGHRPTGEPLVTLQAGRISASIWEMDTVYVFEIAADSGSVAGAVLFSGEDGPLAAPYDSRLFRRQLRDEVFRGESFGLVFDQAEVGLYDYRVESLTAKFASGFSAGEGIWDDRAGCVRFGFRKSHLPSAFPSQDMRLVAQ